MAIDDDERGLNSRYNYSKPAQGATGSQVAKQAPKMSAFPPLKRFNGKPSVEHLNGIAVPHFFYKQFTSTPKNTMDAELNRMKATLTLIVKIKFSFFNLYKRVTNAGGNIVKSEEKVKEWNEKRQDVFIKQFVALIQKEWSGKRELIPSQSCNEPVPVYKTAITILPVEKDFHHEAEIYFNGDIDIILLPGGKTDTRPITANASHGTHKMVLTDVDLVDTNNKSTLSGNPVRLVHNVALHEFGHLIGVDHINQGEAFQDPSKNPYGETLEQLSDIMGVGKSFSIHDYWPFQVAMYYFTGCRWEAR